MLVDKTGLTWLKGSPLVASITSVCAAAFLLFGYDQGVMSGVMISEQWIDVMDHPSAALIGGIAGLYDVGAILGAIGAALTSESIGRKQGLNLGAVVLIIGCVLMGAANERVMHIIGRMLTGVGIGYFTSVAPIYQSEICLPAQRGWLLCCQLTCLLVGILLSYWINYGMYFMSGHFTWRFPLLVQIVFALYMLAVTPWLPETPRWLMFHEATPDRGLLVLSKLRNKPMDDPEVQKEKDEIMKAISLESEAEGSWGDVLRDNNCQGNKRFFLAVGIQFMQQTTGINIVTYYAPTIFQQTLGMSQEKSLFIGGFLQVWYLLASFLTWWLIDAVGRRKLFISMSIGMMCVLIGEAITIVDGSYGAGIVAVAFIFLFEGCFTWGWMTTSWVYPSEILPLKLRAKGNGIAAAANYLGNFLVVMITPPALENIGYKLYIIFAALNAVSAVICWFVYPETAGLPLESVDELFVREVRGDAPKAWWRKGQWSVIQRAAIAVRKAETDRRADRGSRISQTDVERGALAEKPSGTVHLEVSDGLAKE